MSKKTRALILIVSLVITMGSYVATLPPTENLSKFSAFDLKTGDVVDIASYEGEPMLITFWSTDCPYCMKEVPTINQIHNQYKDKGLKVLGIVPKKDNLKIAQKVAKQKGMGYPSLYDKHGNVAKAMNNTGLMPHTVLVSKSGEILMNKLGMFSKEDIEDKLDSMTEL